MICKQCCEGAHWECYDRDPVTGEMKRAYASCFCQHRKNAGSVELPKLGESVDG